MKLKYTFLYVFSNGTALLVFGRDTAEAMRNMEKEIIEYLEEEEK